MWKLLYNSQFSCPLQDDHDVLSWFTCSQWNCYSVCNFDSYYLLMHQKFRLLLSLCVIHEPSQMREVRRWIMHQWILSANIRRATSRVLHLLSAQVPRFVPIWIARGADLLSIIKVPSYQLMPHEGTFQLQTDLPSIAALELQTLFQSWGETFKLEGMTKE